MAEVSARNFGLLVAYLVPGFVALCDVGFVSDPVRAWLWGSAAGDASVGGFLYVTLASVTEGMTASSVRWALLDSLHHATGSTRTAWDDAVLQANLTAFEYIVENHYRYYQFDGNTLVSLVFAHTVWRVSVGGSLWCLRPEDLGVFLIGLVFLAGSRDALRIYYCPREPSTQRGGKNGFP